MASNVSVVLLCLAVMQGINAGVVGGGISSCSQVSSQLGLAANAARLAVSSAVVANKNNIASVRLNIDLQLSSLWTDANLATGPNAQVCRNNLNLDLAQLNNQALNICYYNADANLLQSKVNQINTLKGVANQVCSNCARQFPVPSQSEDLANCVNAGIEDVQAQLEDLQAQISSGADDLQAKSAKCAQDAEDNATSVISSASTNFNACIQA